MIRNWFRTLMAYLKTPPVVYQSQQLDELREELEFHLSSSAQDALEAGQSADEAKQTARDRFGDFESVTRECGEMSVSRHLFWHRVHLGLSLVLMCAVGYLLVRFGSDVHNSIASNGTSDNSQLGDLTGTVVDDRGEPIGAANVLAVVKTWPANGYRQQAYTTVTREDGSFALEGVYPPQEKYAVQIAVIADGHPLQSNYIPMTTGTLSAMKFQLPQSVRFELRFESQDGRPLAGVQAFPFERTDRDGNEHCVYFCSADPIVRRSGATGNVPMPNFLPGERVSVYVRFPDRDWETRELIVPTGEERVIVLNPDPADRSEQGI